VDPVSLVLNALASGAAQGAADSVSDVVKSAYTKLTQLVSARFAGNRSAEVILAEHATDPETWQAPLAKALTASGAGGDQVILEAAQQLMALLDQVGTAQGKYQVDLQGAQGVQVGDGNQQYNTFNSVMPTLVMRPPALRSGRVSRGVRQPSEKPSRRPADGRALAGRLMRSMRTALAGCSTSTAGTLVGPWSSARSSASRP
jgi:hypothetical protein